jgi:hypothetical protein
MVTRLLMVSLLTLACSSESSSDGSQTGSPDGGGGAAGAAGAANDGAPPPSGEPTSELTALTGGNGPFIGAATGLDAPTGYVQHEYAASGTATAYEVVGGQDLDGKWTFQPSTTADYVTRVLVRYPESAADASGTAIVEWLNVSGGVDANPDYASFEEEVVRQGHIWIGVSAQLIGVEGGPVLVTVAAPGVPDVTGKGLKTIDPDRYGSLSHPGDGYSYDIFTQVARAVRAGGDLLGGVTPDVVLAAGESQSAIALTTYYDGVQPLTEAFDGFFIHSRGNVSLPLVGPGEYADLAGSITTSSPALLRDDLDAPVIELQAESDLLGVLNSVDVRQPDSDVFRLWEVAGTSHADAHLLGDLASTIDCGVPINDGPMHIVAKAALRSLDTWVRGGQAPPSAPQIDLVDGPPQDIDRDADGIALGGIRTPPVDVPVDVLSGKPGPNSDLICILLGSTTPLSDTRIAELYASRADYESAYADDAQAAIDAGFVLADDLDALTGYSQPDRVAP